MANMQPNKTPMPELDAALRIQNFEEVALGYTPEEAKAEAERCLCSPASMAFVGVPIYH